MARDLSGALLELTSIDLDEAARRLVDDGVHPDDLAEIAALIEAVADDPSIRERTLALVDRTRTLVERADEGARASDRLRGVAADDHADPTDAPALLDSVWRHELTAPLAVAELAVETLAERRSEPAIVEQMLDVARRNLRQARHVVEGLSSLGDLSSGRIELSWAMVDVGQLVRECVDDVRTILAGRHAIDLDLRAPDPVPADREAVRQILVNLLTNAAKFSPATSTISVGVTATAEHLEVTVRDRGGGLSSRDAERIFDAGKRLDADTPGQGLGLYIARHLARAHGGDLLVERPDHGGGAQFRLRIPTSPAEWQHSLERREEAGDARDARQRRRDATADARDDVLADREGVADQRDATLADREALADERDVDGS